MEAFFFALISYFSWGSGDLFGTIASGRVGGGATTFWVMFAGVIIFSPCIPFTMNDLSGLTPGLLVLNIVLGSLFIAGNLAFNEAVVSSSPSLVATIGGSFTAVTVILSVLFLGEALTAVQILCIAIVFAGVTLCALDFRELRTNGLSLDRGIMLALVAMCSWGVYFAFSKLLVRQIGWFWPTYFSFLLFPLIYWYMRRRGQPLPFPKQATSLAPIFVSALLLRTGDFSFAHGLSAGYASIVAPVAGAYPTFLALLGFMLFKDPVTLQQKMGIGVALTGIVLVGLLTA